jgi:RNA-binding protein
MGRSYSGYNRALIIAAMGRSYFGYNRAWIIAAMGRSYFMLSESQKKHLRGLGHALKPVIMVGDAGLSPTLVAEFEGTLAHHELIKVRVKVGARQLRDRLIDELCATAGAELVQRIGNVALVYRANPKKKKNRILLPN